jgi:hypothetical protein
LPAIERALETNKKIQQLGLKQFYLQNQVR